jgi:hypothetical protein
MKCSLTVSDWLCSDLAGNGLEVEGKIVVCSDNRSLPHALKCDFKWDCLNGTDEENCGKWCIVSEGGNVVASTKPSCQRFHCKTDENQVTGSMTIEWTRSSEL